MIIFSLFMLICMFLAVGLAIDAQRFEVTRTQIQNTTDRAILAAADLEQELTPTEVVRDYFERAGLDPDSVQITMGGDDGSKIVTASTTVESKSLFLHLLGIDSFKAPASGTATESIGDIEIALVLDNSGSMGSENRLNLLKVAAKDFVNTVLRDEDKKPGNVSISIVPFSTQVNAGPNLLKYFNVTSEHAYSNCLDFAATDFNSAQMWPALSTPSPLQTPMQRTGHFDPWYTNTNVANNRVVCPWDASREITTWATSPTQLEQKIDAMWAGGNTSIDIGTKWGLAMLDPSTRNVLSKEIQEGNVDPKLQGQPFDYGEADTMKVLVVMSDGQNTSQYYLKDGYREGPSPVWYYLDSNNRKRYSYYVKDTNKFYRVRSGGHYSTPDGGDQAKQLDWPEVFAHMSVKYFAKNVKRAAIGGSSSTYQNQIRGSYGESTKNKRTKNICKQARDAGIIVYTIGMETYGSGDATLLDCAGSESNFFDVMNDELDDAFAAIAKEINMLRLTQ